MVWEEKKDGWMDWFAKSPVEETKLAVLHPFGFQSNCVQNQMLKFHVCLKALSSNDGFDGPGATRT